MNTSPFGAFIRLISLDQEIKAFHEKIILLTQESAAIMTQKEALSARLAQFKQHVYDLKKLVATEESDLKNLDAQERHKKTQLEQLHDIKQYQPLKKEIDRLKQIQHEKENNLMAIWNKLDIAQKEYEEHHTQYSKKVEEIEQQLFEKQKEMNTLTEQVEQKKEERPSREKDVPAEWLEKYTHMRLRVADPVVPTARGSCSACSYFITEQENIRLKRRALIQCKGCFRLLYMPEAMNNTTGN